MRPTLPMIACLFLAACAVDTLSPPTRVASDLQPVDLQANRNKLKSSGQLVVWGDNSAQQISDAPVGDDIDALAVGGARQGLVIRQDGSLALWGSVGVPKTVPQPIPAAVANDRYESAFLSLGYLLAVRKNHTVVSWGSYFDGTSPAAPAGLKATKVGGGANHSVALGVDGRLVSWGAGPGAITPPPSGKFTDVAGRTLYSIAIRKDGTLFGWGGGQFAADIFRGWTSDGEGHMYIPGERFVSLAAGNQHILALRADGTVAGWGKNLLGENTAPSGIRFMAIAAGSGYSIGLTEEGTIRHWGDSSNGTANVPAGLFASIAAGARHASALRAE